MSEAYSPTFRIGNELSVNRLGFGAMRITGEGIWGPPRDREGALKVLESCIEEGINFIDTADSYGPYNSENLISEALHPYSDNLVIATKGGLVRSGPNQWSSNGHPDHLKTALEGSLKRLKLEQIALYQLHRIDPKVDENETFRFLRDAQEQGLVRHLGLSEVSIADIERAQEYFPVVSVQNKYSYGYREWEDVLEYCEDHDIAFIPWYPLDAGNPKEREKLQEVAEKHDVSVMQIALAWLLHHSDNILLIPGTSRVTHLRENVAAQDIVLDDEDLELLGE